MSVEMQAIPGSEEAQAAMLVSGVLATQKFAPPVTFKLPGDRVLDSEVFFRTSQVADSLRDSAKLFLRAKTADSAVVAQMISDYEEIRTLVSSFVDESLAEGTARHCPTLGADASLEMVLYASTQLCRWIDAIQATPSFLVSEQVKLANAREVTSKVAQALGESQVTNGAPVPGSRGPGQYL